MKNLIYMNTIKNINDASMTIISENLEHLVERNDRVSNVQTFSDREFKRYLELVPEFKSRTVYLHRKRIEDGEGWKSTKFITDKEGNVVKDNNGKAQLRRLKDSTLRSSLESNNPYLYGLRFGKYTRIAVIDIDNKEAGPSKYLSASERNRISYFFKNEYGLNVVWYRSSDSLGWHGYIFLRQKVLTFSLACFLHLALTKAGFEVEGGTLEIYPNIKSEKYALYKGLRCPCAEGFGADVKTFVEDASRYSVDIDPELLEIARQESNSIKAAKRKGRPNPNNFSGLKLKIYNEYLSVIEEGWSSCGQTSTIMYLLITKGKRLGLFKTKAECSNKLLSILPTMSGFYTFCNHTEDLDTRLDRVIESSWYKAEGLEFKEYTPVSYKENKKRQLASKNDELALEVFCNKDLYKKNNSPNFSKMSKECDIKRATLKSKWDTAYSIVEIAPLLYTDKQHKNCSDIYAGLAILSILKMYPILYYTFTLRSKCIEEDGVQNEKQNTSTSSTSPKVKDETKEFWDYLDSEKYLLDTPVHSTPLVDEQREAPIKTSNMPNRTAPKTTPKDLDEYSSIQKERAVVRPVLSKQAQELKELAEELDIDL